MVLGLNMVYVPKQHVALTTALKRCVFSEKKYWIFLYYLYKRHTLLC